MKKIVFLILVTFLSFSSYGQYRWEFSAGGTFSKLGFDYVSGFRAKTSFVFSIDALQRNSSISDIGDISVFQLGFNPKFRFLFNSGKSRFRPYINVGPTFRWTASMEVAGTKLESDSYRNLILGGNYGVGFSQMIGEMFDILFEVGVMNDFTDNLFNPSEVAEDSPIVTFDTENSKFLDFYARVGVRFRIYDARR